VWGLGFGCLGLGFRVWVQGLGLGFRVSGFECQVSGLKVSDSSFEAEGVVFRVSYLGIRLRFGT